MDSISTPNPNPKTNLVFLAVTIFTSLIILCAVLYFLYYLWYSLLHRSRTSPFDSPSPLNKLQRFSIKELKNATSNFSGSNSIGKGGSGTVYRGILKDGKLVAVKVLDSGSIQCEMEFQNELKILGGLKSCPFVVSLLGFCVEKGNRLVVYEYMPNKSLQECLFSDKNLSLNWGKRFGIILDVAKALAFLHLECDPPVIHGDVKPSNVLLDFDFRAKVSDFGLSRLKLEGEIGADLFSQDLGKSQELSRRHSNAGGGGENDTPPIGTPLESQDNDEVDFALALQASSSSKSSCKIYNNVMGLAINSLNFNFSSEIGSDAKCGNLKGKELFGNESCGEDWSKFSNNVPYEDDQLSSVDHSKELNLNAAMACDEGSKSNATDVDDIGAKQWGKDWWWRQDGSGELCSKDYVMEWIGSQICPNSDSIDWDEEKGVIAMEEEKAAINSLKQLNRCAEVNENPVQEFDDHGVGGIGEKEDSKRWKVMGSKKHRKMHEWWKEERMDEVRKKTGEKGNRLQVWHRKRFKVPHFGLGKCFEFKRRRKLGCKDHEEDDENREFSFRKGWKKKSAHSMGSDMWSGDLFSRELSSTTSMRGTLCYVAPEYGGFGYLMEKGDVYSFGVLILVIVSGRRPLHVLSSPMKLEQANLISWSRSLAQSGNVLELVDERLKDEYNRDEASLCINLALTCLQKIPELRPDIGDIVRILRGEMELPQLPLEFSPSPRSKIFSRSRTKQKVNAID